MDETEDARKKFSGLLVYIPFLENFAVTPTGKPKLDKVNLLLSILKGGFKR